MKVVCFLIIVAAFVYAILIFDETFIMEDDSTHVMKVIVNKPK
jgi:hypothetical protein